MTPFTISNGGRSLEAFLNKRHFFSVARLLPLAAVLAAPVVGHAAAIVGNLALSTTGTQVIAVSGNVIDFGYTGPVTAGFPPTTSTALTVNSAGLFDIGGASTGSFAPLTGTTIAVKDLSATQQPTGSTSGPGLPYANFITFAAQPTWSFTLTQVLPGVFGSGSCTAAPAAGQSCTPAGSPFNLTNIGGNQVNVNFAFTGIANDGLGNLSSISGTFGTTFSNTTLQAIYAQIIAGNAVVTTASGTIAATATPIPEPGSASTIILGMSLLGVALLGRSARARRMLYR